MKAYPISSKTASVCLAMIFSFLSWQSLLAQDYQKAWDALAQNDRSTAREYLKKALENPKTAVDAMSTLYFLAYFEGRSKTVNEPFAAARPQMTNPYPYYFLFWYNDAVVGNYGPQNPEQIKFLKKLAEDPNAPGSLKVNARSFLNGHYLSQDEKKKGLEFIDETNALREWQLVAPFDNVVECGFDKNYPPIEHPEPGAVFTSLYNSEISWQKANSVSATGWVYMGNMVSWTNGIAYAQTFVTAPADMDVMVSLASIGNFKVWVNDQLILSDPEMRSCEDQVFQAPCRLKKGVNRILVQNGFLRQASHGFRLYLCDKNGNPLPGLQSSATYAPYPKNAGQPMPERIPFYAETYFKEKLAADNKNLINYLLLAQYYHYISDYTSAQEIINQALEKSPNCALLHYSRYFIVEGLQNMTAHDEESKTIISLDPESVFALEIKFNQEIENENIDEAEKVSERYEELYGASLATMGQKIIIANKREKYQEAIDLIEKAYKDNKDSWEFTKAIYEIESRVKNNPKGAFDVYESFLKRHYQSRVGAAMASEYIDKGRPEEAIKIYEKLYELYPMNPDHPKQLFNFYFNKKENEKAGIWLNKLLAISPNSGTYLSYAAKLAEQEGKPEKALGLYKNTLKHAPNDFDARDRIRELEKKPSLKKYFPEVDAYDLLKNVSVEGKKDKCNWFFLLNEKQVVLYPEQNSEAIVTQVVKVLDEDGVNAWKENSIYFDDDNERLIIEKTELVKPSGKKIAAERNGNTYVFANLEAGDGLIIRYRVQTFCTSRITREFNTTFGFEWFAPIDHSRFCLLAPKNTPIHHVMNNGVLEPTVKEMTADGYTLYTWEAKNLEMMEEEPIMPDADDVRRVLTVSTMKDWSLISGWYGDISARQARNDYEVKKLTAELFPAGEKLSETDKARRIYGWVVKNISYSSVSFRQSGLVPQRASKVIQTRLGDCKDLATLYAALAREVGLKANLVLLSSRNNGAPALALPSMNFNHCLVKVVADGTPWYLELTSASLPFGSLPNDDFQGLALEIPFGADNSVAPKVFVLDPPNRNPDYNDTKVEINVGKKDLTLAVNYIAGGSITSWMRAGYKTMPQQKRLEEFQKSIAQNFNNPVSVKNVSFGNLDQLNDTLQHTVNFVVKNEVVEIGDMSTFKIPFYNLFVKTGAFPEDEERKFTLAYRNYEPVDSYHDEISIKLPAGKSFSIVPANVELSYGSIRYSLKFTKKSNDQLFVERNIKCQRVDLPASEYARFREFALSVVEAEGKVIAFK